MSGERGLAAVLLLTILAGCSRDGPPVVLYVSADEHVARQVIERFEARTGIRVRMVSDTEATKTGGLVERLRAERDHPQADVFWSSEVFLTIALAAEGLLEEHLSDATVEWPAEWRDRRRLWYGFAARARVIAYATARVSAAEAPTTWMDLTRARWKGRIVMADPRFGTTGGHLGAMKAYWDRKVMPGYYEAWLEGLADNGVRLLPSGNAGVVRAVGSGEADIGLTDTDDVWAAQARGRKVGLVYARHDVEDGPGTGTLLIPNTVARIRGGPNPEGAARLIDHLLSEEVERFLAESESHNIPVRAGVAAQFESYRVPDPLEIDLERAANLRNEAIDLAMKYLSGAAARTDAPDAPAVPAVPAVPAEAPAAAHGR